MCLLDDVVFGVQAPRLDELEEPVTRPSFCASGSSNHEPPDHGIAAALHSSAAAILIGRWQMRALLKAHDPLHRFVWSAADRAANNVSDMAAPSAPSNLRPDSMAPARAK